MIPRNALMDMAWFTGNVRDARRFVAYGGAPYPDRRDSELDDFVGGLRSGGPVAVEKALSHVSESGREVLGAYAGRAAVRVVRGEPVDLLVSALVALVIGGLNFPSRSALMKASLIDDAAQRVGVELRPLFERAAAITGAAGRPRLMRWLERPPETRTPDCMRYVAVEDEAGFRYQPMKSKWQPPRI
jgi:hypothetical protein